MKLRLLVQIFSSPSHLGQLLVKKRTSTMMLYSKNELSFHLIEYEDHVRPLMPFLRLLLGEKWKR